MSAEITTDILMLMSTMTLSVAPEIVSQTGKKGSDDGRRNTHLLPENVSLNAATGCLPRADKMAADQKISPISAGMKRRPPMRFPYSCWKGSNMVT